MNDKTHLSNCHRTKTKQEIPANVPGASDDSDQDSSRSKYVEQEDHRKREDGPGGN